MSLIWRNRKRHDHNCIVCMKYLFSIAQKSETLSNYIANLPPPTYQFSRYIDWIEEYIENYKEYNLNWVSYGWSKKRVETSIEALKAYTTFKESVKPSTLDVYIILDTKSEDKSIPDDDKDPQVHFTVHEYATGYTESKANGKRNDALPGQKLRTEMTMSHITTSNMTTTVNLDKNRGVSNTADEAVNAVDDDPGFEVLENPQESIEMKPISTSTDDVDEVRGPYEIADEPSTDANVESEEEYVEAAVSNTVLLFVVNNYDNVTKNVSLKFVPGENMNFRCPITPIEAEIGANSKRDLFTLIKEDPTKDQWGDLYYEYTVSNVEEVNIALGQDDEYYADSSTVDVGTGDDLRAPSG